MIRLIAQDLFFYQRRNWLIMVFYGLFAPIMLAMQSNTVPLAPAMMLVSVFCLLATTQTAFAYDEKSRFDVFLKALPLSARRIVWARYASAMISSACAALIAIACSYVVRALGPRLFGWDMVIEFDGSALMMWLAASMIVCAIALPFLYRFGYVRSRYFLMIPIIAAGAGIPLVLTDENQILWRSMADALPGGVWAVLLAALGLALFIGSVELSRWIYRRKEA